MSNQFSDYFYKIRQEKNISIEHLAKETGVAERNLKFLEEGNFDFLPPDIYVRGYLGKISEVLGADFNYFWKLYGASRPKQNASGSFDVFPSTRGFSKVYKLMLRGDSLKALGWLILAVSLSAYIFWQADNFFSPPRLEIISPDLNADFTVSNLEIVGKTDADKLAINQNLVLVEKDGIFKYNFDLMPGLNILEFRAKNKLGKTNVIEKRIILR